jgi:hypothetical protein
MICNIGLLRLAKRLRIVVRPGPAVKLQFPGKIQN